MRKRLLLIAAAAALVAGLSILLYQVNKPVRYRIVSPAAVQYIAPLPITQSERELMARLAATDAAREALAPVDGAGRALSLPLETAVEAAEGALPGGKVTEYAVRGRTVLLAYSQTGYRVTVEYLPDGRLRKTVGGEGLDTQTRTNVYVNENGEIYEHYSIRK